MNTVQIVYDDMIKKCDAIEDVVGRVHGFGEIIVKKKRLRTYYLENLIKLFPNAGNQMISSTYDIERLYQDWQSEKDENVRVVHCFSNHIFSDTDKALLSFEKLKFIERSYRVVCKKNLVACMFPSMSEYLVFLKGALRNGSEMPAYDTAKDIASVIDIEGMTDIGNIYNFIQCIAGNFETRYFNSVQGNEYTVKKTSANKTKIKKEYMYYQLLPEDMKYWFVMPFNYQETDKEASYMMERLHMTDLAVKWVHGFFDISEFEELMDKYFYFFKQRHQKNISLSEYQKISEALYVDKVRQRMQELSGTEKYNDLMQILEAYHLNLGELVDKYLRIKNKMEKNKKIALVSVIGHGDPCFSNALYSKTTRTLKFIDPKGALDEAELWTNPYYDIAKLSHSICGLYDFFNNALFEIHINENFEYELKVDFDNSVYVEIFKKKLDENGFDYQLVRLYETSLFLSMLPLHIDQPYKVLGFILNAKKILEELEQDAE